MDLFPTGSVHDYARMQIETASQSRLICMLHEQSCIILQHAATSDKQLRRPFLNKVQNIILLLQRSLVIDDATSQSLYHLYDYCFCRLENGDDKTIGHALRILRTLRETFNQLHKRQF
jgi:flagellin-specific chaperone FliS